MTLLPRLFLTAALIAPLSSACATSSPPPQSGDPVAQLPEKRRAFYWKKGCDTPEEEVAEVVGSAERPTILWRARCADGRVLRCSYRRLMKCRWEAETATTADREELDDLEEVR